MLLALRFSHVFLLATGWQKGPETNAIFSERSPQEKVC